MTNITKMKYQLLKYAPFNPLKGEFRILPVRKNAARLTPLRQLAEGWEGL